MSQHPEEPDQDAEAPLTPPPESVEDAHDGVLDDAGDQDHHDDQDADQDAGSSRQQPGRGGPTGTGAA